mgnify:FL=1|jgi:hypothetical protein
MNRKENFINWFGWSLELEDCDSALFMTNYYFDRFEYNTEQKLWLIWLYGTTYYWPTAYVIWNEFPDMELVGVDRLKKWNDDNYSRLRYQNDTKWNKGHLPAQFVSYKEWVGDRTQGEAISEHLTDDPVKNFYNLWDVANGWHKYGRYTSWFYLQTLKQCGKVPLDVDSLWLHDHSGSRSHRNGLCYAVDRDEWVNQKLNETQLDYLNGEAKEILAEVRQRFPNVADKADYFAMETCLCSFKKLFRKRDGRYLGYYLDRQAEEIKKVEKDNWAGIDWQPLWDAREETLVKKYLTNSINKGKMEIYLDTGVIDYNKTFTNTNVGLEEFF